MTHSIPFFQSPPLTQHEDEQVRVLIAQLGWSDDQAQRVTLHAQNFIRDIRDTKLALGEIETFLQHYPLTSVEGRALMTLAEALLRIPDKATADALIAEKIAVSDWKKIGGSGFFGTATSVGLGMAKSMLGGFLSGVSTPVIRKATEETVRRLGGQFVVGETIESALKVAAAKAKDTTRMSFDMLGEGARTLADAETYFGAYIHAITTIGPANNKALPLEQRHGISVKLSALHPRYTWTQRDICVPAITEKLRILAKLAAEKEITLTVDAEESERLELSLEIIANIASDASLKGWSGFGLAVQAYERRCQDVIDYICHLARSTGQRLQVRLVKGAYWDGEIKRAQMAGWDQYPVFTRKAYTDLSYLAAAKKMLAARDIITPMFATHNATTAAAILELAGEHISGFEFQRLYGMGEHLGALLRHAEQIPVTAYAPVGSYEDLLPYLVRRMLENGANTSFVSQIRSTAIPIATLSRDVVSVARALLEKPNPLPLPCDIYRHETASPRQNSKGYNLSRTPEHDSFFKAIPKTLPNVIWPAIPPHDLVRNAQNAFPDWANTPVEQRAQCLTTLADLLEANSGEIIALLQHEGKKTLFDAIAELREAVDFCRYYAAESRTHFTTTGQVLPGPTGEHNHLRLTGRGVFIAISPWNFPLAIFLGQVVAALVAGNTVIAKPAEQTPRIANFAAQLLYQSGIPHHVLQMINGDGTTGAALVAHPDIAGVVFTGSTATAQSINRSLAAKSGPIAPLIAETGGQNAMIADSTALPEQILDDVVASAFGSAGQRCSALRVLFVQNEIADKMITLLQGAIPLLQVGPAHAITTDIGPVIDQEALEKLNTHRLFLGRVGTLIAAAESPTDQNDTYCPPCAYELQNLSQLTGEVFGPILHVIRYAAEDLNTIIDQINATGYGLTFGLQSRLQSRHTQVAQKIRAGNIYINRNMIGAVVGVQPFGGQGLSGTGPKAGGPHYLMRFATEVTITDNIMASGGNIDLINRLEDGV